MEEKTCLDELFEYGLYGGGREEIFIDKYYKDLGVPQELIDNAKIAIKAPEILYEIQKLKGILGIGGTE